MILWSISASVYYAFAIIWPQMVMVLYADQHSWQWAGFAAGIIGAGMALGTILGGVTWRKAHRVVQFCFFSGSALLAGE